MLFRSNSNLLASANKANINTSFPHGWLKIGFLRSTATSATFHTLGNSTNTSHISRPTFVSTGQTKTYLGLPVVGFAVQSFTNGTLVVGGTNVLSNYGGNFVQKATTRVVDN